MTDLRIWTINRLQSSNPLAEAARAVQWLKTEETQPLSAAPIEARVGDVLELWRMRLAISVSKGHTLDGAPELLARLQQMDPRVKLQQVGFAGYQWMGNIFFKKVGGEFVGSVIFDTPDAREDFQKAS